MYVPPTLRFMVLLQLFLFLFREVIPLAVSFGSSYNKTWDVTIGGYQKIDTASFFG